MKPVDQKLTGRQSGQIVESSASKNDLRSELGQYKLRLQTKLDMMKLSSNNLSQMDDLMKITENKTGSYASILMNQQDATKQASNYSNQMSENENGGEKKEFSRKKNLVLEDKEKSSDKRNGSSKGSLMQDVDANIPRSKNRLKYHSEAEDNLSNDNNDIEDDGLVIDKNKKMTSNLSKKDTLDYAERHNSIGQYRVSFRDKIDALKSKEKTSKEKELQSALDRLNQLRLQRRVQIENRLHISSGFLMRQAKERP